MQGDVGHQTSFLCLDGVLAMDIDKGSVIGWNRDGRMTNEENVATLCKEFIR